MRFRDWSTEVCSSDLSADGRSEVRAMLADADVVIENYKVGGLVKYGLDPARLRADFPRLVVCSITGFGQSGPYAHRAGYDYIVQAMSGFMSLTGEPDGAPQKAGIAYADIFTGLYSRSKERGVGKESVSTC